MMSSTGLGYISRLWRWKITNGSSFPSEWYKTFANEKRWVILHLSGKRRLCGWPSDWPDHSDSGYFAITHPEWLLDDGNRAPLYQVERMLVSAVDVEMVEFLYNINDDDMEQDTSLVDHSMQILINAQKTGATDAESTTPSQ